MCIDILIYAANKESQFKQEMALLEYECKSTFYADFSIADCYGIDEIRDTYNRCVREWLNNLEVFTELVMVLNHKIWEHYNKNDEIARLYHYLWNDATNIFYDTYQGNENAIDYFYKTTN